MANFFARKAAKHILKEGASNQFGSEDPYYEYIAATDVQGNATGKTIKRRRPVPPGLTKQEEKVLKTVTRRAHRLDTCINVCGVNVGWEAVIGIIPWIGDVAGSLLALMVVHTAEQAKIPAALKSRMLLNIIIDFFIGLVPLLGDFADAFFRCNTRNAALLYNHLQQRGSKRLKQAHGDRESGGKGRDPSQDRRELHTNDSSQKGNRHLQAANEMQIATRSDNTNEKTTQSQGTVDLSNQPSVQAPPRAARKDGKGRGGWLSRLGVSSDRQPEPDLEHDGREKGRN